MQEFTARELDLFAEALAEGKSVAAAAKAAGYGPAVGPDLLHTLERRFGWQAK